MNIPVLTFFNNKGGVGKTSLVYHLAWSFADRGKSVLVCDLDPQANLTTAFFDEDELESLWNEDSQVKQESATTIYQCVQPLLQVGDIRKPALQKINPNLYLIPGDLALAGFEDILSGVWPDALGANNLYRPFRILTAFWTIMQMAAEESGASLILADVGPNLGAINRSALIATDHVIVPLGADLFSLQGLRNLGPTLIRWRRDWEKRRENWEEPDFSLPMGHMRPLGYVVQQHSIRMSRPVKAYDKWMRRIPNDYANFLVGNSSDPVPDLPMNDPECLSMIKHYRSLIPMAQEVRKPIFHLTPADGAIGGHSVSVTEARNDFQKLGKIVSTRANLDDRTERVNLGKLQ